VSLIARHFEDNGLPTVIVGSARDIVEYCGVARFLFVDFPLGNPCGKPGDSAMQHEILRMALHLFETARQPRTTQTAPFSWSDDESWRARYLEVREEDRPRLRRLGEERRARREAARREGRVRRED
jgi:hypothetical protein